MPRALRTGFSTTGSRRSAKVLSIAPTDLGQLQSQAFASKLATAIGAGVTAPEFFSTESFNAAMAVLANAWDKPAPTQADTLNLARVQGAVENLRQWSVFDRVSTAFTQFITAFILGTGGIGIAIMAMYVVKRRGKGDVLLHMQGLALAEVDDALMGDDLARAIENKEITLAFQPVVDLPSGRLDSLEALARWAPGGRPISPEVFVRAAEACGLADPLFRLVLAQACKQLARWSALPGGSDLRVAVNLSPCQLSGPELVDLVAGELFRWDLDGDRLILEITETGPLPDTAAAHAVCRELRELGVALSVDDFGTGLSSMARLRDLPIDEVKIDRSFITAVDQDSTRARFVRGVLAFAEGFGLTVVAEGIEREEERDALIELGCHRAQGYLFSRPLPAHAVGALLRSPRNWLAGIDDDAGRLASEKP
jgi:EAL domain-containing protein (putative c-di-GMP-specific phosphodiesterase class I)